MGTCPDLPKPPEKTIDALAQVGRVDSDSALWVNKLANHYDALKVCRGING